MTDSSMKKRTLEEVTNAESRANRAKQGSVLLATKRKKFWEYLERVKQLEELELQVRELKAKIKTDEEKYPELLQAKGCADRVFRTEIVEATDHQGKNIWVHADTIDQAKNILELRRIAAIKEHEKKQERKTKKAKKTEVTSDGKV